jgi:hypothetical protein
MSFSCTRSTIAELAIVPVGKRKGEWKGLCIHLLYIRIAPGQQWDNTMLWLVSCHTVKLWTTLSNSRRVAPFGLTTGDFLATPTCCFRDCPSIDRNFIENKFICRWNKNAFRCCVLKPVLCLGSVASSNLLTHANVLFVGFGDRKMLRFLASMYIQQTVQSWWCLMVQDIYS